MQCKLIHDEIVNVRISLTNEYLLTNGRGGYASSTVLNCHTRKYHGLLILPRKGITTPSLILSKCDISAVVDKKEFRLSTHKFPNVYFPLGYQLIDSFTMEDYPITKFRFGDVLLAESLLMPYGEESILMRYELLESRKPITLKIIPLLAYRDIHTLHYQNISLRPRTCVEKSGFSVSPYENMPIFSMRTSIRSQFYPAPTWWNNFEYREEKARGYPYHEDLFAPGIFEIKLKTGDSVILEGTIREHRSRDINALWNNEIKRIKALKRGVSKGKEPLKTLLVQASHYLVTSSKNQKGIIAGYHWFQEWGRDTMISLTGLTLCRGDFETALSILTKYARFINSDGYMPNVVAENGKHSYDAIDTSLFFFWAVQNYLEFTKDSRRVREHLLPSMKKIIASLSPTHEGLIFCGNENTQMTWMDACAYGKPVTPRHGAPIEINALWYNALMFLYTNFKNDLDDSLRKKIEATIETLRISLPRLFWNEKNNSLYDVYRFDGNSDAAIRPNQLFALGLPFTCIDKEKANKILDTIKKHLVTPYGLRTLSPEDDQYKNTYEGDEDARSATYHQGMVWPWLIGIYTDALLKVYQKNEVKNYIMETFNNLFTSHLKHNGLLHISEIFTPDPPYQPKGTIAQAWSMAEIIRTLYQLQNR